MVLLRQLSYAIKIQLKATKVAEKGHFLSFAVSLWHKGGFHIGKGVSNIMIPPILDSF